MLKTSVTISNQQKKVKISVGTRLLIRKCCTASLAANGMEGRYEVNVTFVDNEEIRELNRQFRNKDKSTDVLSFPLGENDEFDLNPETNSLQLGDIVISMETAVKQAYDYGHTLEREIAFLTVHSMLHLLGYDHERGGLEEMEMRSKEEQVLESLGLARDITYINGEH